MNQYRWEVEQIDGKWFCNGYKDPGITPAGRLQLGSTEPVESHEFITRWAAKAQQRFCKRLQTPAPTLWYFQRELVRDWGLSADIFLTETSKSYPFEWRLGNRTALIIDQRNELICFDLPYLVWCWIKTTAVARGLRAFWYGWGQKPSHQ